MDDNPLPLSKCKFSLSFSRKCIYIPPPPALWGNLKYLASADKHLPNLGQKLSKIRNPLRAGENKCQNISSEKIWI